MKKITRILICAILAAFALIFVACNENTSQRAIQTDDLSSAKVESNGGMAVKYGKYLYFVNGYVGSSADNTFGKVVKGSICRTTLDENGLPDYKTTQVIVPKNIYGSDTTNSGIYIIGNYIYYTSTSVEKNSKREYKTEEGVLMRTSLDGTKTETLRTFADNSTVIYASDNSKNLVFIEKSYVYAYNTETGKIRLLSKSNAKEPKEEEQTSLAHAFGGDYAAFTLYNYADEDKYSSDYIVWVYNLATDELKEVMSSDIYNGNTERKVLYTTTLLNVIPNSNGFTLYYSKKGNDTGKNDGFYSYSFSASNPTFNKDNEVRYSIETTQVAYTAFKRLSNGDTLALYGKYIDVFDENGNKIANDDQQLLRLLSDNTTDITLIDIIETDSEVYMQYKLDSTFAYFKLLNKENGSFTVADDGNAIKFFSGSVDLTFVSQDIIGNVIYYLNSDMGSNAYYYVIPDLNTITPDAEVDIKTGKLLGILTDSEKITLLTK